MRILGIETSCDETAAAVVEDGRVVRSSVVSSQVDLHARFGGVVPEIASRAHVELVTEVIEDALVEAGVELRDLDAVAACHGPGLAGALLVGVSAAKALALTADLPYVGVNHLEAHLYAAWLEEPTLEPPLVVLIVSGGHTLLVVMEDHGRYRVAGQTVDDAAGEAFDKVARFLGLGYPGGPAIDQLATIGDPAAVRFPRAMRGEPDLSFAGLKTAVVNYVRRTPDAALPMSPRRSRRRWSTSSSTSSSPWPTRSARRRWRSVAAWLRTRACASGSRRWPRRGGRRVFLPPRELCTDNGAMIAAAAWWRLLADGPTPLSAGIDPNLRL